MSSPRILPKPPSRNPQQALPLPPKNVPLARSAVLMAQASGGHDKTLQWLSRAQKFSDTILGNLADAPTLCTLALTSPQPSQAGGFLALARHQCPELPVDCQKPLGNAFLSYAEAGMGPDGQAVDNAGRAQWLELVRWIGRDDLADVVDIKRLAAAFARLAADVKGNDAGAFYFLYRAASLDAAYANKALQCGLGLLGAFFDDPEEMETAARRVSYLIDIEDVEQVEAARLFIDALMKQALTTPSDEDAVCYFKAAKMLSFLPPFEFFERGLVLLDADYSQTMIQRLAWICPYEGPEHALPELVERCLLLGDPKRFGLKRLEAFCLRICAEEVPPGGPSASQRKALPDTLLQSWYDHLLDAAVDADQSHGGGEDWCRIAKVLLPRSLLQHCAAVHAAELEEALGVFGAHAYLPPWAGDVEMKVYGVLKFGSPARIKRVVHALGQARQSLQSTHPDKAAELLAVLNQNLGYGAELYQKLPK